MRHYFYVKEYNEDEGYHLCLDENGMEHRLVIGFLDGFAIEEEAEFELVGKKISVSYTEPWISFAKDARLE